jgi:hypothetical protein
MADVLIRTNLIIPCIDDRKDEKREAICSNMDDNNVNNIEFTGKVTKLANTG